MTDLKAEVERQSKRHNKGDAKKRFVMMDDSSDSNYDDGPSSKSNQTNYFKSRNDMLKNK